jgi:hypothetical protein
MIVWDFQCALSWWNWCITCEGRIIVFSWVNAFSHFSLHLTDHNSTPQSFPFQWPKEVHSKRHQCLLDPGKMGWECPSKPGQLGFGEVGSVILHVFFGAQIPTTCWTWGTREWLETVMKVKLCLYISLKVKFKDLGNKGNSLSLYSSPKIYWKSESEWVRKDCQQQKGGGGRGKWYISRR